VTGPGAAPPPADPERARIAAALVAESAEERRQAATALPELDVAVATPLLLRALGDHDWRVRKEATLAARRILDGAAERGGAGARPLVDALLEALGPNENVGLQNAVIEVLGCHGQGAVAALAEALPGLDADGRKLAVEALALTHDASALPALEGALSDPDDNVRHAALEAIAALGVVARAPVVDALIRALDRDDQYARLTALHGLNALEAPVPWELLAPLMEDSMLRPAALSAAALAESPEAPAALVRALPEVRGTAFAQILGALSRLVDGPLAPHAVAALRAGGPTVASRLVREASEPPFRVGGVTEPPSWRGPGTGLATLRGRALVLAALARAEGAVDAAVRALAEPSLAEPAQRALRSLGALALPAVIAHLALDREGEPRDKGALQEGAGAPPAASGLGPDHVAALIDVAVEILQGGDRDGAAPRSRRSRAPGALELPPAPDGLRDELCALIRDAVRSASTLVANSALYALAKLGVDEDLRLAAAQTLSAALPVARAAERALAALAERHPAAARALAQEMMQRDETYLPAAIVLDALGVAGPEELAFLAHAAAAGDVRARRAAVVAAAATAGPAALDVLSAALADEEREVQLAAARALGRLCALLHVEGASGAASDAATRAGELLELVARSGDADLVSAAMRAREAAGGPPAPDWSYGEEPSWPGEAPSWTAP
jgi:HEAT repeat protein